MPKNTDRSGVVEAIRQYNPPDGFLSGDRILRSLHDVPLHVRVTGSLASTTLADAALAGHGTSRFIGWTVRFIGNPIATSTLVRGESSVVTAYTDAGVFTFGALSAATILGDEFDLLPPWMVGDGWTYAGQAVTFAASTGGALAEHELLTVSGQCRIKIMAICTTNVAGAGSIQFGVGGATSFLIGSTLGTDIDANEIWNDATPTTGYALTSSSIFDIVSSGVDVGYEITGATLTSGTILFGIWWMPLNANSYCVAATIDAGGAI